MDQHDCYELCVQSPRHVAPFLYALHGGEPTVLREDFSAAAALSRRWISDGLRAGTKRRAVAVDLDPAILARATQENETAGMSDAIRCIQGDCTKLPVTNADACDIIFVGNFSIGYIHDRPTLLRYLRASHQRLALGNAGFGGGILVCDTYSGPGAFKEGSITRTHPGRGHELVRYTWEQRSADALTAMVTNVLHFQVEIDGEVVARFPDAFTYHWRLWSIPELREAMIESGFTSAEVHQDVTDRPSPIAHGRALRESGIVCIVGRTQ